MTVITIDDLLRDVVRKELEPLREELRRLLSTNNPGRDDADYLTVQEAADFAKVNPGTIRDWLKRGVLPRHGRGKVVRVRRDELHAAMKAPSATKSAPDAQAVTILQRVGRRR